jgi:hypothetical protein
MSKVPEHYISRSLSKKQKAYVKRELRKSRKAYKKKVYYTRKKVKGYRSRRSSWENRVKKVYNISEKTKLSVSLLSRKSKCSKASLNKIVKKGMGAYYSSGSRPNQTAHSWGYARLYSALAGGPAAKVDMHILKHGCKKSSKSLKLARNPRKNTTRKHVQLGGYRMKERITKFERSPLEFKKYRAFIKDLKTGKESHLDFGDNRYQQFKDRTPLGYYKSKNHNNPKRMRNYFNRHSGTPHRGRAIELERKKSKGRYNSKILSHEYLW